MPERQAGASHSGKKMKKASNSDLMSSAGCCIEGKIGPAVLLIAGIGADLGDPKGSSAFLRTQNRWI